MTPVQLLWLFFIVKCPNIIIRLHVDPTHLYSSDDENHNIAVEKRSNRAHPRDINLTSALIIIVVVQNSQTKTTTSVSGYSRLVIIIDEPNAIAALAAH